MRAFYQAYKNCKFGEQNFNETWYKGKQNPPNPWQMDKPNLPQGVSNDDYEQLINGTASLETKAKHVPNPQGNFLS